MYGAKVVANAGYNGRNVAADLFLRVTQEHYPGAFDAALPFRIVSFTTVVYGTVNFNRKRRFGAVEIDDEGAEWLLPAELPPPKFAAAKRLPQHGFPTGC
jgi:hypothetical protein